MKKEAILKHCTILSAYLVIVWGFYRFLFKLPDEVEELFIKPVLWLIPVFYLVFKEKANISSLGITTKKLFPSIYISVGLGVFFALEALLVNYLKYKGNFNFSANIGQSFILGSLFLSFATATSEEIVFRGYLFNRVWSLSKNEWMANIVTSLIWALVHVPVVIFVWKLGLDAALIYLFLTTIFGMGSAFVFARTGNVVSSIILHVLWEWPIILFR